MDLKKFKMENGMSCVTLGVIILWERVREEFSRNIFSLFSRKQYARRSHVTFLAYFPEKQYARRSHVAFLTYFPEKQYARRSHVAFLAYFPEKQHARLSCVTSGVIIPLKRARKRVLRYLKKERVQRPIQIGTFEHVFFCANIMIGYVKYLS